MGFGDAAAPARLDLDGTAEARGHAWYNPLPGKDEERWQQENAIRAASHDSRQLTADFRAHIASERDRVHLEARKTRGCFLTAENLRARYFTSLLVGPESPERTFVVTADNSTADAEGVLFVPAGADACTGGDCQPVSGPGVRVGAPDTKPPPTPETETSLATCRDPSWFWHPDSRQCYGSLKQCGLDNPQAAVSCRKSLSGPPPTPAGPPPNPPGPPPTPPGPPPLHAPPTPVPTPVPPLPPVGPQTCRQGFWFNSETSFCYDSRDSCAAAFHTTPIAERQFDCIVTMQ